MKKKIILQKDIPNLGVAGDVKDVSPGYARNYLLPRGMAVPATERHLKKWDDQKEKLVQERQEKLAAAQGVSKTIQDMVCTLSARAGKDGKLFGSVTTEDVAKFFREKGIDLDRRWVEIREPIRTTGEFLGAVRLHPQVRASFKIQVNPIA
ncbi:MAG: 50S ribosomal protein L9 [Elusimicrobia bacterium]|nr:50S ribosomal protein L9 [Elusimicrobiota bacterium]